MAVAIFGGSFDPVHNGHIAVIREALRRLPVRKILVVPAGRNPFKSTVAAPGRVRAWWLARALRRFGSRVWVETLEIRRRGPSRTIDTVEVLKRKYGKIYLIIGADNLTGLPRWHRYRDLARLVTFVVAHRDRITIPRRFVDLRVDWPVSSTRLRRKIVRRMVPASLYPDLQRFYTQRTTMTFEERIDLITKVIDDKKGEAIEAVDLRGSDYFVDGVVIATTMASKHALSIVVALKDELKKEGEQFLHVDESDDWTIIDLGDLLIHLMSEEYRKRYHIEDFLREFAAKRGR